MDWLKKYVHFILLSLPAFIYIIYRAFLINITNDEAYSYFLASQVAHWKHLFIYANTHWLNSFFILLGSIIPCENEFPIRLHSVLAFVPFAYYTYKIISQKLTSLLAILVFSIFIYNPYVLDFFSLARGYALALAFEMVTIYFFLDFERSKSAKQKMYLFACLAVLSVYTHLYFLLALLMYDFYISWKKGNTIKKFILEKKWFLLFVLGIISHLLLIRYFGDLHEGENNNFIQDAIANLISNSIYYPISNVLSLGIAIVLILAGLFFLYQEIIKKKIYYGKMYFLLLIIIAISYLFHFLMASPFPSGRTALFLYPLLFLYVLISLASISKKMIVYILYLPLLVFCIYHYFFLQNIAYSKEWAWCHGTRGALQYMRKTEGNNIDKNTLALHPFYHGVFVNYYKLKQISFAKISRLPLKGSYQTEANYIFVPKKCYLPENYKLQWVSSDSILFVYRKN